MRETWKVNDAAFVSYGHEWRRKRVVAVSDDGSPFVKWWDVFVCEFVSPSREREFKRAGVFRRRWWFPLLWKFYPTAEVPVSYRLKESA